MKTAVHRLNARQVRISFDIRDTPIRHIEFTGPKPPDYRQSYSGSALPYPNKSMAYDKTPTYGSFACEEARCAITIDLPNAYYTHLGTHMVHPYLDVTGFDDRRRPVHRARVELGEVAPYRRLTWPPARRDPTFYTAAAAARRHPNQESHLRAFGYPATTPANFWGAAIPPV